ncbi:C6 zinc finger domain-containing protein [Colletotrichum sojae]|uniref:C6 zinc finger domain-containing protein n=1 Tax=Colletotrichum sojae TaxID=2175907 RepID=A0A8H6IVW6_9PEZI|nr:C6 zinc finger domain-containing protein [Colletotrichum sojae]
MPKGSRQYHGKTKNGCRQCKKRRVKVRIARLSICAPKPCTRELFLCDCVGPVCANCRRRQEHCSYLGLLADALNRENGGDKPSDTLTMVRRAAAVAAHASSRDALNTSLPAEKLRADEAELKHHFLTEAWFTFSLQSDPRKCDVWSRWVPQLASRNVFIHQSMLSIAALHLCYLEPPDMKRYYSMACHHAIQASNYFRLAVPEVTEENWLATFVFAMCNGIFGYYRPFADEKVMGHVNTFEPAKALNVMRVAAKFSDTVTPHVFKSPIRNKLAQVDVKEWIDSTDVALRPALYKISCFVEFLSSGPEATGLQEEDTKLYLGALTALKSWISSLPGRPRIWKHFILWPSLVSEQYLALLRYKEPVALMIFVVWCEVMFLAPRRWYLMAWYDRGHGNALKELSKLGDSPAQRFWETLHVGDDGLSVSGGTPSDSEGSSDTGPATPPDVKSEDGGRKGTLLLSTGEEYGNGKGCETSFCDLAMAKSAA